MFVGGIIGSVSHYINLEDLSLSTNLRSLSNYASIEGIEFVGGIVGFVGEFIDGSYDDVSDINEVHRDFKFGFCRNNGKVAGEIYSTIGGILGAYKGKIYDSGENYCSILVSGNLDHALFPNESI
jgi:hypothetical protein